MRCFASPVLLLALSAALGAAIVPALGADATGTRRDADVLKQKVASINTFVLQPSRKAPTGPRRTAVSEREVNAYLTFEAGAQLPVGVVDPSVAILGTGRVSGRAIVDLDTVRKQKNPTSLLDPTMYLTGRLPVTAIGVLRTSGGTAQFDLQSATVGGLPIPKLVLQEIVSYYSRTPENPGGLGLDERFMLPAGIREIQIERGQAIIVQ